MFDYNMIYKEKKKPELKITVGKGEELVIKVSGKTARHVFERITDNPKVWDYLEPVNITSKEKKYSMRADVAPIIISYVLLNRRSPKPEKWDWYLNEVLDGRLSIAGKSISGLVEMFFTLSNMLGYKESSDVLTSMFKTFADRVRKYLH
ncbi:MAG: hypothetical protein DRJ36_00930 [Thermoprotei archaeon]|nr:MAG: hypothetical protein DRJ36_00930 [Thermoprotei archaeon]